MGDGKGGGGGGGGARSTKQYKKLYSGRGKLNEKDSCTPSIAKNSLREHPVFLAQVSSFTRQEKLFFREATTGNKSALRRLR